MFAHRMCRECFVTYLQTSGGIHEGSSNPPSFTLNLRKELRAKIKAIEEEEIARWVESFFVDLDTRGLAKIAMN